jgi:hypothetical protein
MSLQARITSVVSRIATEFKTVKSLISGNNTGNLSSLATTNKDSLLEALNEVKGIADGNQSNLGFTPENEDNKGNANGYASLDGGGKVPAAQLPAFVDDVLQFADLSSFPSSGESGILYVAEDTNIVYRWTGSNYVSTNGALALGETSSTAYRGDRGKIAYDHSQVSGANPHATTFSQLNSKPTTISGFGITDAFTKTEIGDVTTDFVTIFETAL